MIDISNHDPVLFQKICRVFCEYLQLHQLAYEANAKLETKDRRLEKAPEIVALFDEYGQNAVLAAVNDFKEFFVETYELYVDLKRELGEEKP